MSSSKTTPAPAAVGSSPVKRVLLQKENLQTFDKTWLPARLQAPLNVVEKPYCVYLAEYQEYLHALQDMKRVHLALTRRDPRRSPGIQVTSGVDLYVPPSMKEALEGLTSRSSDPWLAIESCLFSKELPSLPEGWTKRFRSPADQSRGVGSPFNLGPAFDLVASDGTIGYRWEDVLKKAHSRLRPEFAAPSLHFGSVTAGQGSFVAPSAATTPRPSRAGSTVSGRSTPVPSSSSAAGSQAPEVSSGSDGRKKASRRRKAARRKERKLIQRAALAELTVKVNKAEAAATKSQRRGRKVTSSSRPVVKGPTPAVVQPAGQSGPKRREQPARARRRERRATARAASQASTT